MSRETGNGNRETTDCTEGTSFSVFRFPFSDLA